MANRSDVVLVLGATGQQGGATARALRDAGWKVRALVRDDTTAKARALSGVEIHRGDYLDPRALAAAMEGVYGVFSVQASSPQTQYRVTDEDETRAGIAVADAALRAGVSHFVYTSMADLAPNTGVGHFESKWQIEEHVRRSGLRATIVRPTTFMELLLEPYLGLSRGHLFFFTPPERPVQVIASDDIGRLVARVFDAPERFVGETLELAGDTVTGAEMAAGFSRISGRRIVYAPLPEEMLAAVPMLKKIAALVERGGLEGRADLVTLRSLVPDLVTFETWLDRNAAAVREACGAGRGASASAPP